jgi:hypothetical protein
MDPTNIADERLREQIQDPYHYDFRDQPSDKVIIEPDIPDMTSAVVDIGNQNVKVSYEGLSPGEYFNCVEHDEESQVVIVESERKVEIEGRFEYSKTYYIVNDEEAYRHTGTGLKESSLEKPVEVAHSFQELISKALEQNNESH